MIDYNRHSSSDLGRGPLKFLGVAIFYVAVVGVLLLGLSWITDAIIGGAS